MTEKNNLEQLSKKIFHWKESLSETTSEEREWGMREWGLQLNNVDQYIVNQLSTIHPGIQEVYSFFKTNKTFYMKFLSPWPWLSGDQASSEWNFGLAC